MTSRATLPTIGRRMTRTDRKSRIPTNLQTTTRAVEMTQRRYRLNNSWTSRSFRDVLIAALSRNEEKDNNKKDDHKE